MKAIPPGWISWKLKAIKYDYIAQKTIGIGAFVVEFDS